MNKLKFKTFYLLIVLLIQVDLLADEFSFEIKVIEDLFNNMDYENCLKAINRLEQNKENLHKSEILELYKYKAFIYITVGEQELAKEIIKKIYTIDPHFVLPPTISPKLREPFIRVSEDLKNLRQNKKKEPEEAVDESESNEDYTLRRPITENKTTAFFKNNITFLSMLGAGIGILIPGILIRLDAASDAESYQKKIDSAMKDELGNPIGIKKEDVKRWQDEIDRKVLIGNSLILLGSAFAIGGITGCVIKSLKVDNISVTYKENSFLVKSEIRF